MLEGITRRYDQIAGSKKNNDVRPGSRKALKVLAKIMAYGWALNTLNRNGELEFNQAYGEPHTMSSF